MNGFDEQHQPCPAEAEKVALGNSAQEPSALRANRQFKPAQSPSHAPCRDITEDDDGYHPYADLVEPAPLFEEDPWR